MRRRGRKRGWQYVYESKIGTDQVTGVDIIPNGRWQRCSTKPDNHSNRNSGKCYTATCMPPRALCHDKAACRVKGRHRGSNLLVENFAVAKGAGHARPGSRHSTAGGATAAAGLAGNVPWQEDELSEEEWQNQCEQRQQQWQQQWQEALEQQDWQASQQGCDADEHDADGDVVAPDWQCVDAADSLVEEADWELVSMGSSNADDD